MSTLDPSPDLLTAITAQELAGEDSLRHFAPPERSLFTIEEEGEDTDEGQDGSLSDVSPMTAA